jgi:membrane protease subunit HflC
MAHDHHHHHHHDSERVSTGKFLFRVVLAVIIVGLLIGYSTSFQVSEGNNAVVTRFGDPRRPITEAGLFFKWPWPIEEARQVDVRRRIHNPPFSATFTRDQKNVILLTYVVWRTEDPLLFLQSVGSREEAERKLSDTVVDRTSNHVSEYDLSALVSTNSEDIKTDEIEAKILADVAKDAWERYGIRVEQVGIKRIAYPEENMTAVLEQMKAERQSEAGKLRAEGEKAAGDIMNDALVRRQEILREGQEKVGEIRGRAESQASQILEKAMQQDPDFYQFWRSLQAMEKTLGSEAMLILRTDQGPFRFLEGMPGLAEAAPQPDASPLPNEKRSSSTAKETR